MAHAYCTVHLLFYCKHITVTCILLQFMLVTHTLVLDTHTHIKMHLTRRGEVSSFVEREIAAVAGWKLPSISTY